MSWGNDQSNLEAEMERLKEDLEQVAENEGFDQEILVYSLETADSVKRDNVKEDAVLEGSFVVVCGDSEYEDAMAIVDPDSDTYELNTYEGDAQAVMRGVLSARDYMPVTTDDEESLILD